MKMFKNIKFSMIGLLVMLLITSKVNGQTVNQKANDNSLKNEFKVLKKDATHQHLELDLNSYQTDFEKAMFSKLICQDTLFTEPSVEKKNGLIKVKAKNIHDASLINNKIKEAKKLVAETNKSFTPDQKQRAVQKYNLIY